MSAGARMNVSVCKASPTVPPGPLVYTVGDIHGRDDLLARRREAI